MQTEILGINRVSGAEIALQANQAGEQLVAAGDADYTEVTRGGFAFTYRNTTAVAAVTSIPTTATNTAFRNSDADGGRSVIIDAIWATQIGNGAAALSQFSMIYVLGQTRVAAQAVDVLVIRKTNSLGDQTSSVVTQSIGGTALDAVTGVAIGWNTIGSQATGAVASLPGMSMFAWVNGRIIIAPGRILGLHVLGSQTTPTWNMGIMWHEKTITLA